MGHNDDTVWLDVDVVFFTVDAIKVDLTDDTLWQPVWIKRDDVIDYEPGDKDLEDATRIEVACNLAELKELI